ncbi:CDP-diacylglycerol--serine O-phosphatidyltransferase [Marinactinospora rubrisoli]|uniref:CDP-diacylglycerol--serine O-phosphatidyltransferase n=1 Tax=Marinactinospora rubrisoli TaxID=2715399 RepID=A0ABW2KDX2_9ACTN
MTAIREALPQAPRPQTAPPVRLALADYLTLGNALCGFMAVWQLASAQVGQLAAGVPGPLERHDVTAAVTLLLIAAVCDLFDGRVARKLGGSDMGAELDNLADVISFGFAPAFFVVVWGSTTDAGLLPIGAAAAVLLAVVVRLARFSCQAPGSRYFTGLPSPLGAVAVITVVLLDPPGYLGTAAVLLVAWLMVSRVEYPKPQGRVAYGLLAAILAGVGCLSAWAVDAPAGTALLYSGCALLLLVVLTVPFYVLLTRRAVPQDDAPAVAVPPTREG